MTLQTIEPVLYLPDDTPFFAEPGEVGHTARLLWRAGGFVLLCFLAYLPVAIWGGLVWQDDARVTQNVFLWGAGGLAGVWAHAVAGHYSPLAQTILWIEHHFFRSHPLGYHLVSIFLHAVDAGLLWMVLRRLAIRGAWLAAALFAIHPLQVQSVAWISQQSHLVGAAFALGSVWAFLRFARIFPPPVEEFAPEGETYDWDELLGYEPFKRLYAVALLLAAAACLSDPIGLAIPFVLLTLVCWKRPAVRAADWIALAPFFAVAAAVAITAHVIVSRGGSVEAGGIGPTLSIIQRLMVGSRAIWASAASVVWPYPLLFVYARWNAAGWWQMIFVAALLAVILAAWLLRKRIGRGFLVATVLFIVLLLPEIISAVGVSAPVIYVADHWAYLALAVPAAAVAQALVAAVSRFSFAPLVRGLRVAVAAVCLGGLGILTWNQGSLYDNEESPWRDALYFQPTSSVAINEYTRLLLRQGRDADAWELVRNSPESGQEDLTVLLSRAQVYISRQRYREAIECYQKAHSMDPHNDQIERDLAEAYARDGQLDKALQTYEDQVQRHPNDVVSLTSMGLVLMQQGKVDEAISRYEAAIAANSRFIPARINVAQAYELKAGKAKTFDEGAPLLAKAAKQLQQVVAIDPRNFVAFYDAGVMLYRLRDFEHAEKMFAAAAEIQPDNADAWDRLGICQSAQGTKRLSDAVWNFDHAVRINPDFEAARQHLEQARRELAAAEKASAASSDPTAP